MPNVKRVQYCGFELRAALLLVETKERENARRLAKIQTPISAVLYSKSVTLKSKDCYNFVSLFFHVRNGFTTSGALHIGRHTDKDTNIPSAI